MNTFDAVCPCCGHEFIAVEWESGQCPKCGTAYVWDEQCDAEYTDCWTLIDWAQPAKPPPPSAGE